MLREKSRKMAHEKQCVLPFPIPLAEHLSPTLQDCPGTELLRLPAVSGSLGTIQGTTLQVSWNCCCQCGCGPGPEIGVVVLGGTGLKKGYCYLEKDSVFEK